MSNNERRYLENIARNRCGYWDVCDDHACGCAPDADVSQGFDEQVYEQMRLEQLKEAALEGGGMKHKPECYKAYHANVCLGKPTRKGTTNARCQQCKWLEKGLKK